MSKITHKLPLKNVKQFHPELKDVTEDVLERKSLVANFTSLEDGEAIGIVSTPSIDQDGDIIDPMGVRTDIYNGTVQFNHSLDTLPIGNIPEWTITPEGVTGKFIFSKTYDFSIDCYNLVKEGILRGISIGYVPLTMLKKGTEAFYKYAKEKGWNIEGCERIITSCLWIETSLCPVGCNQDALVLAAKNFKSEMSFKSFKVEKAVEDVSGTDVTDEIDDFDKELEDAVKPKDNAEKFFETKDVSLDIPLEKPIVVPVEDITQTDPVQPDVSKCEPDVSEKQIAEEPVIVEEKPIPVIKIIRRGGYIATEEVKQKALKFLQGKSF